MALSTKNFLTLVRGMVAAVQSGSSALVNLNVGSVLLAIVEAIAAVILWLQGIVVYVLTLTRAATSQKDDLDSWMADFGFLRLLASDASGQVTFSRITDTAQAVVPFGSVVQTADGTQQFTVDTDSTNAAYSADLGGYVMAPSTASVTVSVTAVNGGTQGNVAANTITSISGSIPGIDTVTNASAFINGIDAESDPAFLARFPVYLASLSKATKGAVDSAIDNIQQGIQHTLTENEDYNGTADEGYFYVVIDDGTGNPPSTLLDTVGNAIEAVRGLTTRFGVFAPNVITATPTAAVTSATGYVHSAVVAAVALAFRSAINALPLGMSLPYTQLAAIAYAVPGVTNVTGLLLNGATSDLTATDQQVIKCGTPVVS